MESTIVNIDIETVKTGVQNDVVALNSKHKKIPIPTEENWKDVLQSMQVSLSKIYKQPPTCIEIMDNGGPCSFGTLGNFSALIGKAKSRKTFLISLLLASSVKNELLQDVIRVSLPPGKHKSILFDTEQSQYDVSRVVNRIIELAEKTEPGNFEAYSLRALAPADRAFIIEQKIYDTEDLGIIVIDGIRDLISDINSPDEATRITSKLLKWTEERNIHIITVLHQNKGDNNARGHLGTEVVNKAESVVSVEKDNEISVVSSEYFRGKDFKPFAFSIDMAGFPYILQNWSPKDKGSAPKITAYDIPKETHFKILREVFGTGEPKKYKDLECDLRVAFQSTEYKLTNRQVIDFIAYYKMNSFLVDPGGKGRAGNQYRLNTIIVT